MIVLVQAFKRIKSKNQYNNNNNNNNNINNLRDRIHSNAYRLAYSRQQYEARITKDYSAIVLPMLRRTCDY